MNRHDRRSLAAKRVKTDIVKIRTIQRAYPATPDGSQWEIKFHFIGDMGGGEEVLGECTVRSYNGGILPLPGFMTEAAKATPMLVEKVVKAFAMMQEQMQRQQGGKTIEVVQSIPREPQN